MYLIRTYTNSLVEWTAINGKILSRDLTPLHSVFKLTLLVKLKEILSYISLMN